MGLESLILLSGLIVLSFTITISALWVLSVTIRRPSDGFREIIDTTVFVFDGDDLVSATDKAAKLLARTSNTGLDWSVFLQAMSETFPYLQSQICRLPELGKLSLFSGDGSICLQATWNDGVTRITLVDTDLALDRIELDRAHFQSLERELETLRKTTESAPFLVWRQNPAGRITWANNTYLELAQTEANNVINPAWPPAQLFELPNSPQPTEPNVPRRLTAHIPGEAEPNWFECFETRVDGESVFTAVSADKVVKAEIALQDFIQTLTKTFAHLKIGLAIFDKQRRLALFNPALIDLTSLPASFLTGRPTLHAVLDQLRERQMIPEPKNYKSWRKQLYELEAAASNGTYEETWSLANGQTYRVTGRPHPDGAVAFLFEDISAEISLTRRFRAELKSSQAVLDSLQDAIAVFSPNGALTLSNSSYGNLWGIDPTTILGDFGIVDATRAWAVKCAPSPVWGDVREFVGTLGERAEWTADVQLRDGRKLICRFTPISGGATLAEFAPLETPVSEISTTGRLLLHSETEAASV
ncbi:MAG: PAS-domain containing protein [Paracoccaceae bacterium]